eukprot:scaffold84113_cov63-Phaeocystis_antarctica.AAC.2
MVVLVTILAAVQNGRGGRGGHRRRRVTGCGRCWSLPASAATAVVEVAAAIGRLGLTPASRQRWRLALAAAATAAATAAAAAAAAAAATAAASAVAAAVVA